MNKKQITRVTASLLLVAGTAFLSGCNKDDDGTTTGTTTTVTDQDGNSFKTVAIGTQTWMAENLKVTDYNDGTAIPNVTDGDTWANLTSGAQCTYDNTTDTAIINRYGRLYNWYAVDSASNGGKNICPAGWHVPSEAEWTVLSDYLGGYTVAGGKMKESWITHWHSPNTDATNSSGFTALPGGYRLSYDGYFGGSGYNGNWWSSTEYNSTNAYDRSLYYYGSYLDRVYYDKQNGFSVRCLKN